MKKYIIKISIFVLILFSIICLRARITQHYLELAVKEVNLIPEDVKILAFGDSHIHSGVNDNLYPMFQNRASSGEGYYYNYIKLRDVLSDKRNNIDSIQCIVLAFNSFSFSKRDRDSIFVSKKMGQFVRNYRCIHQNKNNSPSNFGLPIDAEYLKKELFTKLNLVDKRNFEGFIKNQSISNIDIASYKGGFNEHNDYNKMIVYNKDFLFERYCLNPNQFEQQYQNSIQIKILEMIAQLTFEYRIPLILVNAPCHESFYSVVYEKLEYYNNSVAEELNKKYGVIYLDYLRYPMDDSCFYDSDHLNRKGANIFTPILLDTLTTLGLYRE